MGNLPKQDILNAIQKTAKANGGKPLGINRFEKETGIKPYDWQRYWPQFSKAQQEAGFSPNQLQVAYSNEFLFEQIISLARKLNKFPTFREIRIEKINNPEFPDNSAFNRAFGSKQQFSLKLAEYCQDKNGYENIIKLCEEVSGKTDKQEASDNKIKEVFPETSSHNLIMFS